jgi:iron-sulfur cluster repair protein YtfE (RIC family)
MLDQHNRLRAYLDEVGGLARALARGERVTGQLSTALSALARHFDDHNDFEESTLLPLLAATDAFGDVRIARMHGEHLEEHRAFAAFLASPLEDVAAGWDDFAEEITAHMEAEERTFLHPQVLRDDLVTADTSSG